MESDMGGSGDTPPLELLTEMARDARNKLADPSTGQLDDGFAEVSARITAQRVWHTMWVRLSWAGAFAACVLAIVGASSLLGQHGKDQPPALSYRIEGGELVQGGYLRESGTDSIKLRFAEGTEFVLMPGTRGRLHSVSAAGARIAIEHGTASFQVTPRQGARWEVDVGPFLVTVKGTAFTVSWDPTAEHFDLRLAHGLVSVTGPVSTGTISVRAGQRLSVDLPRRETVITEQATDTSLSTSTAMPSPSPARLSPASPQEMPARNAAGAERRHAEARAGARRSWSDAVTAGDWDRILDDVERVGVKHTLAHASSEELLDLADAARYRRRTGLAKTALLAERTRFPGTGPSVDAAFLLGRLAEQTHGSEAVQWYDSYLDAAPTGTYASEALGRKMMVTKRLKGSAEAELIARDYLRRFPAGPYAGAARALLPR
jgi:TolA-binding protein